MATADIPSGSSDSWHLEYGLRQDMAGTGPVWLMAEVQEVKLPCSSRV